MKKLSILAAAVCCAAGMASTTLAQTYNENFDNPFGDWTTRWFYQNTNAGNYYVATGNCDENNRGNNSCGLWVVDTQTCGSGVGGPTCSIEFDSGFGASIQSFAWDHSGYVDHRITVYDMSGNIVLDVPTAVLTRNPCQGHRYTATSSNGISRIVMDSSGHSGSQIEGNTAWDNIEVIAGPPSYSCTVTGQCPGTVNVAWDNAQPNRQQGIVFASNTGSFTIPGGPCAGTTLGLGTQNLRLVNTVGTGGGSGSVNGQAGTGACGGYIQLVTVANPCEASTVDQLP